jgi:hypothetical protein
MEETCREIGIRLLRELKLVWNLCILSEKNLFERLRQRAQSRSGRWKFDEELN